MSETVIYEFTAKHATEDWETNPEKMVDGTEASYAETNNDREVENLITNECVGTDLGTIFKVELAAYGYGDGGDKVYLRPVFAGGEGNDHTVLVQSEAGWSLWQDITSDPNSPGAFTIYEQQTASNAGQATYGDNWKAQTFKPSIGHDIERIDLYLGKYNNPSGVVTVGIRATADGKPTGSDLTSGTIDCADIIGPSWYVIPITSYSLTANVTYAIVVRGPGDSTNYIYWQVQQSDVYANGSEFHSGDGGSSWATYGWDFAFKEGSGLWSWSDIQSLDCDVDYDSVAKANVMYCGMVKIQVTYEPSAPPPPAAAWFGVVV